MANNNDLNNLMKKQLLNNNSPNSIIDPLNFEDKIIFDKINSKKSNYSNLNLKNISNIENTHENLDIINSNRNVTKNSKIDSVREKISVNYSYDAKLKSEEKTKTEEDLLKKVNTSFKKS